MKTVLVIVSFLVAAAGMFGQAKSDTPGWCNIRIPESAPKLPTAVVKAIMDSKEGRTARDNAREYGVDPYADAPLYGIRFDVAGRAHEIYVVGGGMSDRMNLTGGDNRWYWVVERTGQSAVVLLFAHTGCLRMSGKVTNRYHEIEADWRSTTMEGYQRYAFDGLKYKRVVNASRYMCEMLKPEDRKQCETDNKSHF